MACKKYLFIIAISIVQTATLVTHTSAKEGQVSYNKSVFSSYMSLPVNKTAVNATIKDVKFQFPGWVVTTDKVDGRFTDIYGTPLSLPGGSNSDNTRYCISGKLTDFGVQKNEWKQVSDISTPKAGYVYYTREINGHPVVFSRLSFRFTPAGELMRIQMKNYGTPGNISPVLTADEAKKAAADDLDGFKNITITHADVTANWCWFPVPSAKGYELRPSWRFSISGKEEGGLPLKLKGYVDAVTGAILYRTNEVKATDYDLTVKGMVYTHGVSNPASLEPLPDLELQIGAGVYYTDTGGRYAVTGLPLPQSTIMPLQGKWSTVYNDPTNVIPTFTNLISVPGAYTYPTTSPSSSRHVNAYYHVNKIHNFMKTHFPLFTDMDFSLPTYVDVSGGSCNAYYTGSDINFFAAGGGCVSFAEMGDVVYHEYGHGISDLFYTMINGNTIQNGALNEANSDIWGLSITHDPVLAKNAFTTYGGFIRRYDGIPQVYPVDIGGEVHKDGQIIAGCWWDVSVNIGNVDTMSWLFSDVYYEAPDGPDGTEGPLYQKVLIDALMADDNDANLFNGTPHYSQIVAAFAKHGIYLEGDAFLIHTELSNQPAGQPIAVTASLGITTFDFLHDLTLHYRVNNTGAWTPVTLSGSALTYTGTIPAQPAGSVVEYYFVAHDSLGIPNAYFPLTCNPTLPDYYTSIPFQFGAGIGSVYSMNFDNMITDWGVAHNAGDNATAGLWDQAVPTGTAGMWPYGDHSTMGSCLATGKESDSSGVKRGASTVLSPIFDISAFAAPVIEYYRWFSNEFGNRNFKNDPWIVKIRDASSSTWQTVENTYQSDANWRRRIFPISAYLSPTTTSIQVKFFASDSLVSTLASSGQSRTVNCLDDFFIYDKGTAGVNNTAVTKANIFPIPADNCIQAVFPTGNKGVISLYNMAGRLVAQMNMEQSKTTYSITTKELPAGTYNLVIKAGNSIQSKMIAVMHK